ncbi:hypothetical protein BT69DRAFT_1334246 [Atractiella rhizophila]|nr:hypothetical protein BT69DRAFT_1334246 [Atractiella rhizophila]
MTSLLGHPNPNKTVPSKGQLLAVFGIKLTIPLTSFSILPFLNSMVAQATNKPKQSLIILTNRVLRVEAYLKLDSEAREVGLVQRRVGGNERAGALKERTGMEAEPIANNLWTPSNEQ